MKHILLILLFLVITCTFSMGQTRVKVYLDTSLHSSYTGRLFVFMQSDTTKGVGLSELDPQPAFAIDVKNWKRGDVQVIDEHSSFLLGPIQKLKPGTYKVAALLDINTTERAYDRAPGNIYATKEAILNVSENGTGFTTLTLNAVIKERQFKESTFIKEAKFRSNLLSTFHHEDRFIKAGIVLPESYYSDTTKIYPVVYIIPGWGGTHFDVLGSAPKRRYGFGIGTEKIYVYLNPESQTIFGLHAFVDSRVNGPWGKALIEEFIPYISKKYRAFNGRSQTFLLGQSSGGYASLWLMFHYPKTFAASWGASPDPVDFTSFTGVDLYNDKNFFVDKDGQERMFFKWQGKYLSNMRKTAELEAFIGDGGQTQSFEAEFGSLDKNDKPELLFNRKTGEINKKTVNNWSSYDMSKYLLKNWVKLKNDLKGRIYLYAGAEDNYGLNLSLLAFKNKATQVQADITIEIINGADHFSIWSKEFNEKMYQKIDSLIKLNY